MYSKPLRSRCFRWSSVGGLRARSELCFITRQVLIAAEERQSDLCSHTDRF